MIPEARPIRHDPRGRGTPLALAALLGLTALAYRPLIRAESIPLYGIDFVADAESLAAAPHRVSQRLWTEWVQPPDTSPCLQPLTRLSFLVDRRLAEILAPTNADLRRTHVAMAHLTNLLLHLLCVAVVYALARRLEAGGGVTLAVAAVFALHPVQVEGVAWLARRPTLLATAASLLCALEYLMCVRRPRRWRMLAITIGFAAAVLSRPTVVALPLVFVLLDAWPLRRLSVRTVAEKWPLWIVSLGAATLMGVSHTQAILPVRGVPNTVSAVMASLPHLVARAVWPAAPDPLPDWPSWATVGPPGGLAGAPWAIWLFLAVVVGYGSAAVAVARRSVAPAVVFGIVVALVLPFLTASRLAGGPPSDAALYAVLGFLTLPAAAVLRGIGASVEGQRVSWPALGVMVFCVVAAIESYQRASAWTNADNVLSRVIEARPQAVRARVALASWHLSQGRPAEAQHVASVAAAGAPHNARALYTWGASLLALGRAEEAIAPLRLAAELNPRSASTLRDLGLALREAGQAGEAVEVLTRAAELRPQAGDIRYALGRALLSAARPASARRELQIALELGRNEPWVHFGLAVAWAENSVPDLARRHLTAAVSADRGFARLAAQEPALRQLASRPEFAALIDPSDKPPLPDDPAVDALP